jgi:hypothetical protein
MPKRNNKSIGDYRPSDFHPAAVWIELASLPIMAVGAGLVDQKLISIGWMAAFLFPAFFYLILIVPGFISFGSPKTTRSWASRCLIGQAIRSDECLAEHLPDWPTSRWPNYLVVLTGLLGLYAYQNGSSPWRELLPVGFVAAMSFRHYVASDRDTRLCDYMVAGHPEIAAMVY